ncbi:hypothetical protein MO867_17940 [Microbulbifer sp. OS29]|uniref:Zinc ribbon domain-containing protein n=1 Tax=Microbulbifer okhotskensis TaxID=2926617 RepID=A0A9X2ERT7_9GAMM|nr:hypothetical protein [Microbulbifer okhotskensis]MCO1336215.1 hypothetical protein [Microbulbifer okhotskensis]
MGVDILEARLSMDDSDCSLGGVVGGRPIRCQGLEWVRRSVPVIINREQVMAMVKCKECGESVSTKAKMCPGCGAPAPKKGIGIIGLLAVGFVGYIAYQAGGPLADYAERVEVERSQGGYSQSKAQIAPKPPAWYFGEFSDEMTGEVTKVARLHSVNTTQFDWPYSLPKGSTLSLVIRKTGKWQDAYFSIDKGQMLCSASKCDFRIKIGDSEAELWPGIQSPTYDSDVIFIENDYTLRQALKAGRPLKVGIKFHKAGERVFEFETAGYKPI